ncbi:MAG: acylneuraminate cytidylyltransferase [candidate division NC10 bacterium]
MKTCAIIPARGGSKGIPHKNVRLLAGKPLLAHTIDSAWRARGVDRVVVSTDDPEIAAVAQQYGAEVVRRPEDISQDTSTSELALIHVLDELQQTEDYEPDLVVFLQCTSPLTLPEDIDGTINQLLKEEADSALAVTPFHYYLWRREESGDAIAINHDPRVRPLRQEREPQYLETGGVYVMRAEGFRKAGHRFHGKTVAYVMPPERCLEIDEPVDFLIAEVMMRHQQQEERQQMLPLRVSALVLDFDGVFTDNRVLVFQDGTEAVVCHRGDGLGLSQLRDVGMPVLVLSSEENPLVRARCEKLKIECLTGVPHKEEALRQWLETRGIDPAEVVYVGNDVNDLNSMRAVGCSVAVSDAPAEVRNAAKLILSRPGGRGAVREVGNLVQRRMEDINVSHD